MKLPESWTTVTLLSKILAISLFVSLPFVGFYFGYQYGIQSISQSSTTSSTEVINSNPIDTPTIAQSDFSEIENIFQKISEGSIVFNKKRDNVDIYQSEYLDLTKFFPELTERVYLQIDTYKYTKGSKLNSGYEGFEWVVDLDQWKSWLQSINIGENKINITCSDGGCQKLEIPQSITVKKINDNKYYISDAYFPPGGNSTRTYTSFDSKSNLIINVRLDYYSEKDSIQILGVFSKMESLLP